MFWGSVIHRTLNTIRLFFQMITSLLHHLSDVLRISCEYLNNGFFDDNGHIGAETPQIAVKSSVCSTVFSVYHHRKHQSSELLALCERNLPVDSPHKWTVTQKKVPCHVVIMSTYLIIRRISNLYRSRFNSIGYSPLVFLVPKHVCLKGCVKCDYMYCFSRISHAQTILYIGNIWLCHGCGIRIHWDDAVE